MKDITMRHVYLFKKMGRKKKQKKVKNFQRQIRENKKNCMYPSVMKEKIKGYVPGVNGQRRE